MRFFVQTLNSVVAILNLLLVCIFMWFFSMILFSGMDGATAITRVVDTMGWSWDALCSLIGGLIP